MLDGIRGKSQSLFVKLAFAIIILVFVFWGVGGLGGPVVSYILTVNDTPITEQDFARQYQQSVNAMSARAPELAEELAKSPQFRQQVLQQLVLQTVLLQEAERVGLVVTPFELRKAIETFPVFQNSEGKFDADLYISIIEAQGQSLSEFEDMLKRDMLLHKLQNLVTAGAYLSPETIKNLYNYNAEKREIEYVFFSAKDQLAKAKISDEAVQEYYDAEKHSLFAIPAQMELDSVLLSASLLAKSLTIDEAALKAAYEANIANYATPEQVQARHIILLVDENVTGKQAAEVEKKINDLSKRLEKGESFEALAKEFSEDGTAAKGGDLGFFTREQMVKPFSDAAFALKDGEISKPLRTQFGYHLIKREAHKSAGTQSFEEVKSALHNQLALKEAEAKLQEKLDAFLLTLIGGKTLQEAAKEHNLTVDSTKKSPLEEIAAKWQLNEEQMASITKAPIGTVLESPLTTAQGYLLVLPKSFTPAAVKELKDVKDTIVETLRQDEAILLASNAAKAELEAMEKAAMPKETAEKEGEEAQKTEASPLVLPKALNTKIQKLSIGRDGMIGEMGSNLQLSQAVFSSELGKWIPESFMLEGGTVLVRVVSKSYPTEAEWQAVRFNLENSVTKAQKDQLFQLFANMLSSKAKLEMHNDRLLRVE